MGVDLARSQVSQGHMGVRSGISTQHERLTFGVEGVRAKTLGPLRYWSTTRPCPNDMPSARRPRALEQANRRARLADNSIPCRGGSFRPPTDRACWSCLEYPGASADEWDKTQNQRAVHAGPGRVLDSWFVFIMNYLQIQRLSCGGLQHGAPSASANASAKRRDALLP